MAEKRVGKVEHYYPKVKAAAVHLSGAVKLGDTVHIVGHGDDVTEKVTSLQLDHVPIEEGKAGQHIGLLVPERVHEGDEVLLVKGGTSAKRAAPAAAKPKAAQAKKAVRKPRKATGRAKASKKTKRPAKRAAKKRSVKARRRVGAKKRR